MMLHGHVYVAAVTTLWTWLSCQ